MWLWVTEQIISNSQDLHHTNVYPTLTNIAEFHLLSRLVHYKIRVYKGLYSIILSLLYCINLSQVVVVYFTEAICYQECDVLQNTNRNKWHCTALYAIEESLNGMQTDLHKGQSCAAQSKACYISCSTL